MPKLLIALESSALRTMHHDNHRLDSRFRRLFYSSQSLSWSRSQSFFSKHVLAFLGGLCRFEPSPIRIHSILPYGNHPEKTGDPGEQAVTCFWYFLFLCHQDIAGRLPAASDLRTEFPLTKTGMITFLFLDPADKFSQLYPFFLGNPKHKCFFSGQRKKFWTLSISFILRHLPLPI